RSIAFSPDGTRIVSAGDEPTIYVWDTVQPSPELAAARYRVECARRLVTALFAELGYRDEVVERLQTDCSIDEPLREAAIRIARACGDDADLLSGLAGKMADETHGDSAGYHRALKMMEAACNLAPEHEYYLVHLGVAR